MALPPGNKDHDLKGTYKRRRECHIAPDWLLIYEETCQMMNITDCWKKKLPRPACP